ncbi:alkaline phosphatase PhoX [Qipengyuania sphaerica]|uniref:alkaline phosphatase PhoX n=1 Tax=Qipengyuania sphaerica TaxID=2867243 RepID=UPI001C8769D3|nr:alkaline phosphatase PhoX [Qipengyuania sphaerica]MBX7539558.1 PhoX family protein [Qipengyuania sphaerica]
MSTRRTILKQGAASFAAFVALGKGSLAAAHTTNAGMKLVPDEAGLLDLPEGFSYRVLSRSREVMSDGFMTPGSFDGMGCFAHPTDPNKVTLVRNHEIFADMDHDMPFGDDLELLDRLPEAKLYDWRTTGEDGGRPFYGGTTTLTVDLESGETVEEHLSLVGTTGNCAGGTTPWGSWLTCEEQMLQPGESGAQKHHGFVYEVPSAARGIVDPVPLKAMGRFVHEAASVDPATGIVYMTEDNMHGLFWRFIPDVPGELARGGRLQALAVEGWDSADLRNWPVDWSRPGARRVEQGERFVTRWIDLDDVESPNADLARRGFDAGAAMFCRGEGLAYGVSGEGKSAHFFNCTQGGVARTGQVWRYDPSPQEGGEGEPQGTLTLLHESPGADTLDLCDNLAVSPWGDLIICEDGMGQNYLRGLTPQGVVYDLARNAHEDGAEFCGSCFSPDGSTLFVNVQSPGMTYAITGPWEALGRG